MTQLLTFKEISIGGVTKEHLIKELTEKGIQFNPYAHLLFKHPSFVPEKSTKSVKLVKLKLVDLNLTNPCSYERIVIRAYELGLRLCPIYLGAFLRLNYLDQPQGPYLTIASAKPELELEPDLIPVLENDKNYPTGFYIRNFENALWLRGYSATGETDWPIENEFVFLV